MIFDIDRTMLNVGNCRVSAKKIIILPILCRSERSRHEVATAVRTNVTEDRLDTFRTERTFVGANSCRCRRRRQFTGAILTDWSQFKHGFSPMVDNLSACSITVSPNFAPPSSTLKPRQPGFRVGTTRRHFASAYALDIRRNGLPDDR